MARPKRIAEFKSARDIMRDHGVDAIEELVKIAQTEVELTDEESRHPAIQSMLGTYDLVPGEGGKWILRLGVSRRIDAWKEIARYSHPQLRSTEFKVEEDRQITVIIQSFKAEGDKVVSTRKEPLPPPKDKPIELLPSPRATAEPESKTQSKSLSVVVGIKEELDTYSSVLECDPSLTDGANGHKSNRRRV